MTFADAGRVAEYPCADDLMQAVIQWLLDSKDRFDASRGSGTEGIGASLRLANPRARLSRSEMRGKIFSALGEFFWCLAGSDSLEFIRHYIQDYDENSDDGTTLHGAYGPRLFGHGDCNQVQRVIEALRANPGTRRAVIQIFAASDLKEHYKDAPCTCTLQAVLRNDRLNLIAHMRSNDAYLGLPHDIFVFTMLQELIARALQVDVGFYHHLVGNLHLYDRHRGDAERYLGEEVQSVLEMPPMPIGDPWSVIPELVGAEAAIRNKPTAEVSPALGLYWDDLMRLLRVHSERRHALAGYESRIAQLKTQIAEPMYRIYIP